MRTWDPGLPGSRKQWWRAPVDGNRYFEDDGPFVAAVLGTVLVAGRIDLEEESSFGWVRALSLRVYAKSNFYGGTDVVLESQAAAAALRRRKVLVPVAERDSLAMMAVVGIAEALVKF